MRVEGAFRIEMQIALRGEALALILQGEIGFPS